ncbi:MAG: protein adenylyltransferase SelO [Rhizomicrobium sp.]
MGDVPLPPLQLPAKVENRFAALPGAFYTRMAAEPLARAPRLIHANEQAASLIGLDSGDLGDTRWLEVFSGRAPFPGGESLAMVYSGHQFGAWAGQLGDGRALLIAQVRNPMGELWDVQLKGSGLTPYSRFGDGRAVMRSTIREYLASEAMAALSIPSTRAMAVVETGEMVRREQAEPGAILTRLARSHVRFGHFEHFHHAGQPESVRLLADHVIQEYLPHFLGDYGGWFGEVVKRTARLIALWQAVGFAHGVMNTDNMSILGVTLDYGPFGFMDAYDPDFVCNHSDETGRYAFANQPGIGLWNLKALAVALSSLMPSEVLVEKLNGYEGHFMQCYHHTMRAKLGLTRVEEGDKRLIGELLALMAKARADYTQTFRGLSRPGGNWPSLFGEERGQAREWLARYLARMAREGDRSCAMDRINPKYVLRNWVAETAIRAAADRHDTDYLDRVLSLMQNPWGEHPEEVALSLPPPPQYCGLSVSCSS